MGQQTSTGEVRLFTRDIEKKYGLPEGTLFKQAGIESAFGKAMLSPKGAQGWFGFMPATAKEYGLADPNDFRQSADAAGRKMRDLLKKHDGNIDYALVDYNGGGKAVTALQAGKPWKESAGYLAKFHGMTADEIAKRTSPPPALGEQFTSATTVSPTDGASATALGYAQRQHDNEYGGVINGVRHLPDAISLGFQTQNTVYNFWKDQGVAVATGDLLDLNAPEAQDTLKQFPQNYWGYLMQSSTREGFDKRAARLRDSMQKEQELGNLGVGPALIGGVAGGLVDLPTVRWANAFLKASPDRTPEQARKWAGWYARTVEEAHMSRSADHLEEMMTGYDEKALLESLVRNGGFTESDARALMRDMFKDPSKDAGRTASSLRHRNTISETHTEKWRKAGEDADAEITINDFIKSNALDVSESYFRRTASSIALADRLDIYKQSDIGSLIDKATAKTFGAEGFSEAAAVQAKKDLKFAVDRIQGIPQEEFSMLNKAMSQWRDFNVIRLMGGAVWNQVSELSQIVGSMGWKVTLGAASELRAIRRDIATGKAPHDFLDHLENTIGGVGSEYVARLDFSPKDDWVRYKGDTPMNRRLDALDSGTKKVAKGVLDYTGMTGTMIQQKRIHAIALVNHFVNAANGSPSKFLSKDRLAWMGMSEADYANLKKAIAAHTKGTGKGDYGTKHNFDIKAFAKAEPEMNSMLMNALHRETRRVVQENDLASMVPLMGTTLGKTVFQFMNFSIHGWNKSMLFAMNHKDFSTLSTVLHGGFFASLAYMGRTQLSAMGMDESKKQEFLDKRMSTKQIVANSFGRISQASLLPTAYDTTLGNFTGAMFAGTRTTSDVTSFASNPTLQAVNGVLSLGKIVRNAASDDLQTTQRDIKTWGRLLPLNNTALVTPFLNALANDYPTNEDATK